MRLGRLDRKITVQRAFSVKNDFNEDVETWQPLYRNIWASKRTQSGREALNADQIDASEKAVFTIHYKKVEVTDRVIYEGKVYNIRHQNEVGRRHGLELICEWQGDYIETQEPAVAEYDGGFTYTPPVTLE